MGEECFGWPAVKHLLILVEGHSELNFVKNVLAPHFIFKGIIVETRMILTSRNRKREFRGGLLKYGHLKNDLQDWMRERSDQNCHFSTMIDFYALPLDFPRYELAQPIQNPYEKVKKLEEGLEQDINHPRFIPYIQLHEFETFIFSDPQQLEYEYLEDEHQEAIEQLRWIIAQFNGNPELIDEGRETAPSKRIRRLIPEYNKITGASVVEIIGIELLRNTSQHFNQWITKLEQI